MSEAPAPTDSPPGRRSRTWVRDILEVGVIALVLYVIIWVMLQTVRVEGQSMVPTLQDHDFLLASKISYRLGDPERGDIVILIPPANPATLQEPVRDFIKRVVGLPGDMVKIDGNQKPPVVMIQPGARGQWERLDEPYLDPKDPWVVQTLCCTSEGRESGIVTPVKIPSRMYLVLGDNRNRSSDSRSFGFVPRDNISAKAFLRVWPFDHFGRFGAGPALFPATVFPIWLLRRRGRVNRFRRRGARAA